MWSATPTKLPGANPGNLASTQPARSAAATISARAVAFALPLTDPLAASSGAFVTRGVPVQTRFGRLVQVRPSVRCSSGGQYREFCRPTGLRHAGRELRAIGEEERM